ncbi:MAG: hypothetical protein V2I41_07295 [Pseudomonadales bacterium]|jgi:hypothetical protein|nr:hypothetical protein [Pseudomonadales bacterium]
MSKEVGEIVKTLAVMALDYLRCTQFVPMMVAWAFLWLTLMLMALANFQQEGFVIAEALVRLWERHEWLPRLDGAVNDTESGGLSLNHDGFVALIVSLWWQLSTVLFLLSLIKRVLLGSAPVLRFTRKVLYLMIPAAITWLCFVLIYAFGRETFHGSLLQWLLMFTLGCAIAFVISLYSLGVSALITLVQDGLEGSRKRPPRAHIA